MTMLGGRFDKWRTTVLTRDHYVCQECGSTVRLEAHHIIALAVTHSLAFLPMNGVTLCHECHTKTDNYCALARVRAAEWWGTKDGTRRSPAVEQVLGRTLSIVRTIPHKWQAYPTVGNYSWTPDGILVVFVSDMGNEDYAFLVGLHELVEATLVKKQGISVEAIDAFDIAFEQQRVPGNTDEPGHDPRAPYRLEHMFAEHIERQVAKEIGVDWDAYEQAVMEL